MRLSGKIGVSLFLFAFFAGLIFASPGGISGVKTAASTLCKALMETLPVVSMLMIIGAGIVYAAGQIMGAETRARATTWATAMLIGAIIGILIVTVAPSVLSAMYDSTTGSIGVC